MCIFCVSRYGDPRYLHVLTHSFPTRRSSDLIELAARVLERGEAAFVFAQLFGIGLVRPGEPRHAHRQEHEQRRQSRRDEQEYQDRQVLAEIDHGRIRSEEHTSELQSLMSNSYDVFCLKKQNNNTFIYN